MNNNLKLQEELSKWREWAAPIAHGWQINSHESDEQLREKISLIIKKLHEENVQSSLK